MKYVLAAIALAMLSGCQSMMPNRFTSANVNQAGQAQYSLTYQIDEKGNYLPNVTVFDSKSRDQLKLKFTKNADGSVEFELTEDAVKATEGQALAAQAQAAKLDALKKALELLPVQ